MARSNKCPNPAAKNNATGYSGTATPTRVTTLTGTPRATGVQATTSGYIQTPNAPCAAGDQFVVSLSTRNGTAGAVGTKTVYVSYTRSAGGDVFPETFTINVGATPGDIGNASFVTAAAPAGATGIYLIVDALASGVAVSGVMYEPGTTVGTYADGDTSGWAWDGADGNSSSSELAGGNPPVAGTLTATMSLSSSISANRAVSGALSATMHLSGTATGGDSQGGAVRYEIEDVMDALAAVFNGVPTGDTIGGTAVTIEAHAEVVGQVEPPGIVLELDNQDFDLTMGHGSDSLSVVALLLVTYADMDNAQRLLWRFLSRGAGSGLFRVKAALEADQTLGGLVSYAIMSTVRNIGIITYNGVNYLGAELIIEVML